MRLLVRRMEDAFPELGVFTPQQRMRFIRAARGRGWRRFAYRLTLACVAAVVIAGVLAPVGVLFTLWLERWSEAPWVLWLLVLGWPLVALGVMAGMLRLRDLLLKTQLRCVIRIGGHCAGCGYGLLGLPVSATLEVCCPECGMVRIVDRSLLELAAPEAGSCRVTQELLHAAPRFWTRRRRRWGMAMALAAMLLLVVAPGVVLGGRFAWRHWVAWRARHDAPSVAQLDEIQQTHPTIAASPTEADAHAPLMELVLAVGSIDSAPGHQWGLNEYPDFSSLGAPEFLPVTAPQQSTGGANEVDPQGGGGWVAGERELEARCRAHAQVLLNEYEAKGAFAALPELTSRRRFARDLVGEGVASPNSASFPEYAEARRLARILMARARLARVAGDRERWIESMDGLFALPPLLAQLPTAWGWDQCQSLEFVAISVAEEALGLGVPASWLSPLDEILARHDARTPLSLLLDASGVETADLIANAFGDPAGGNLLALYTSRGPRDPLRGGARSGSYDENRRALAQVLQQARVLLQSLPPPESEVDSLRHAAGDLVAMRELVRLIETIARWETTSRVMRDALRTDVALARFRAERGDEPASLDELVPGFLPSLPPDPYHAGPLRYKRISPALDPEGRTYLMYSVGVDRRDDGGTQAFDPGVRPLMQEMTALWGWPNLATPPRPTSGIDYVFNRGPRRTDRTPAETAPRSEASAAPQPGARVAPQTAVTDAAAGASPSSAPADEPSQARP